ncbi:TolC family protein [Argonema antarcticum]|uniref:TolC family protein n=1 Tax=Argonema antarcticum TaxID=2942763 RepID=UPI002011DA4B|nr:TolC family protein [Argonema antarcticum]MCL1475519.1 TolC family protein [Argonema antarcticum A004/B2]
MFRHLVVVSVSAALAELVLCIAGSSTPGYALSKGSAEDSPAFATLTQTQHHLSSSEPGALGTVSSPTGQRAVDGEIDPKVKTSGRLPANLDHHSLSNNSLSSNAPASIPGNTEVNHSATNTLSNESKLGGMRKLEEQQTANVSPTREASPPLDVGVSTEAASLLRQVRRSSSSLQSQAVRASSTVAQNRIPETLVPSYLQPNPNPLQFPTRIEEVDIEVTQPLTLQQVVELARRNNRDLQVALLQLERATAALREAQAALYPTVDLQADAAGGRSTGSELSLERNRQLNPQIEDEEQGSFSINGTLGLNYDLYTAGRRSALIRAAQEQLRINQLEVERLNEQIRLDLTNAYYDLQQADEQVRISGAAVRNAQQSLRDAQALETAGLGTRFDTLRAQVQLANENQNLIRNRSQQQINRRIIVQLLSLPQSVNVTAADPVEIAGLWDLTLEQSIIQAFQNRAELQQQLAQRNIGQQQRRAELAAQKPQLSLFANYNLLDTFNDGLGLADGYSVGARLRWNLFDGGAAQSRAAQRETDIAIAETQFANTRNQVRLQVEQSYYNLQSNLENIQTATTALEQATEALRLARLRFGAGVGTQTEVIDAETELTRAEGNRVQAIIDYNRALASLQRSISNLLTSSPPVSR